MPLPLEQVVLERLLAQHGWYTSVLTPPTALSDPRWDPKVPVLLGAMCRTCATRTFPPEVLVLAEQRRQGLLADLGKGTP